MDDCDEADLAAAIRLLRLADPLVPIAVRTASSLGLADQFERGPATARDIAERLSLQAEPLERLLRLLAQLGILAVEPPDAFRLGETGAALRSEHPFSMRDAFGFAETELRAWLQLEHCIRTGRSGFEASYSETHRSYRARHGEEDARMDRVHKAATRLELAALAGAYPWARARLIVDVGGGTGMLLAGLLRRFGNLQGILFDLPRMIANAPGVLEQHGVSARCRMVGGDFFEEVPAGGDVYVLKAVVGGWDDDACCRILETIHRAMRDDSRLLIIEPLMTNQFSRGNLVQLHTLVLYGGRDRSIEDYRQLADACGLSVVAAVPRPTLAIIELARETDAGVEARPNFARFEK
jgi:hypothetical protein